MTANVSGCEEDESMTDAIPTVPPRHQDQESYREWKTRQILESKEDSDG